MFKQFFPGSLAECFVDQAPCRIATADGALALDLQPTGPGVLECTERGLHVVVKIEEVADPKAVQWNVAVTNVGTECLSELKITPLFLRFRLDASRHFPRVRHLGGSYHYDGTYPPPRISALGRALHDP